MPITNNRTILKPKPIILIHTKYTIQPQTHHPNNIPKHRHANQPGHDHRQPSLKTVAAVNRHIRAIEPAAEPSPKILLGYFRRGGETALILAGLLL